MAVEDGREERKDATTTILFLSFSHLSLPNVDAS